jgi:ribosome-associated protein
MENAQTVTIREEPIELCQLLKFAGLVETGGEAKTVISESLVSVNGEIDTRKRRKIMAGDRVTFNGQTIVAALG